MVHATPVLVRPEHRNRNVLMYMRIPSTTQAINGKRDHFSFSFYIMSMPPIPPMPPGIAGASSFGNSATMQSVVSIRPATEAAFCNAERVTLVGSSTPISTMSP